MVQNFVKTKSFCSKVYCKILVLNFLSWQWQKLKQSTSQLPNGMAGHYSSIRFMTLATGKFTNRVIVGKLVAGG
jgi:hypothetical protein